MSNVFSQGFIMFQWIMKTEDSAGSKRFIDVKCVHENIWYMIFMIPFSEGFVIKVTVSDKPIHVFLWWYIPHKLYGGSHGCELDGSQLCGFEICISNNSSWPETEGSDYNNCWECAAAMDGQSWVNCNEQEKTSTKQQKYEGNNLLFNLHFQPMIPPPNCVQLSTNSVQ